MAFDAPKPRANTLSSKEFFKPELHISTSNLPLEQALDTLSNKSEWTGFAAKYGQAQVYLDPRSGAATSISTRVPLIPGHGVGNTLGLADVSLALGRKVGQVDFKVVSDLIHKFVVGNSLAIGIDSTQLGAVRAEQVSDTLWNVTIPQLVNGVPVRYGHLVAVINNGNLVLLGTETWGNVSIATTPKIAGDEAVSIGFAFAGGRTADDSLWEKPSLEIVPVAPLEYQAGEGFAGPIGTGYRHRLVWSFGFQRKSDDGQWEILVDAQTGEVLSLEDRNQYEKKKVTGGVYPLTSTGICPSNDRCGQMFPDYPMPWADTGLASPNNFTNSAGLFNYIGGTATTNFSGKYVAITDSCGEINESASGNILLGGLNGQHDCTSAGASFGDTPASRSAFYEINKLKEMARGWLPANTWLQAQLETDVNNNSSCNAFYSPSLGTINFYRSGGGCRNTGEIAAVLDHEWGHGLDDNDTGGAMSISSEAYADVAAVYRLQASCAGYGFSQTRDDGCGMTSDGTGFNANESNSGVHCTLDCSGSRDVDWNKHADHTPDTPQNFSCGQCFSGSGPCGRAVHCDAAPSRQAAWDFVARDLTAAPFNMALNDAFLVGNKVFYQGSGIIGSWHACTCPSTSDGCGATNAYMAWLAADDDNGNLADGTPHMTALFAAFNRHNIACATPTPTNSGCAGGPTIAPALSVSVGNNALGLSWTAVSGAVSYRVLRSEGFAGCDFGKAVIATVTGTSYTDPDVANTRTYSYVVQPVGANGACAGPGSACVQGTPQLCAGAISFSQDLYNCSGAPLNITLVDGDLAGTGTHAVSISSNSEPGPETLVLTETPANSGEFTGTFGTTTGAPTLGDGAISIANGDSIAVDYADVDYCGTPNVPVHKSATVDCAAPIITNVQITNIIGNSVDVTFSTNEPTDAVVHYGTNLPPAEITSNATLTTSHALHLVNLSACAAYVVSVQATDPAGNSTSDSNAGAYYGFLIPATATPNFVYTGPPVAIPDNTTVTASLTVADTRVIQDINVKVVKITHTFDGDLVLTLIAPNGTRVQLANHRGGTGEDFTNTVFDDEATTAIAAGTPPYTGSFKPEALLSVLDGIPANGTWTLEAQDTEDPDAGTLTSWEIQFQLAGAPCPTAGQVTLDKASYQCTETSQIHVVDFSIVGAGTQSVAIASTTEGAGEAIVLNEIPANSGSFFGSITLTTAAPATGDGILSVADGGSLTVTYVDADDGSGGVNIPRTDSAIVDCGGPTISNVQAMNVTGRAADITWTTNEGSSSEVFYGTSSPPLSTLSAMPLVTGHTVHLSGLAPCTAYLYYVRSTDATNNNTIANNGGAYFGFTTSADSQPAFSYSGPAVPIPDNNSTGATASIVVSDVREVLDVNVLVNVSHLNVSDLELYLIAPDATQIPLALRRGFGGDNFTNTLFDDGAATAISAGAAPFTGSFRPESPLAALNGILSNGTWSLKARDRAAGTTGTISSWQLQLTLPVLACNMPFVQEASHPVTDTCSGAGSNAVVDPGEDLSIALQVANTGFAAVTGVVGTLSTSTPDVVILDGTTSYGALGRGGFSSGDGPFVVSVGSTVPCGTLIGFQLHVTANEGSWDDSFSVQVGALPITQTTYPSTDTPRAIPDVRIPPVRSSIVVSNTGSISDVNVAVNITHTFDGDLTMTLIGPNGSRRILVDRLGGSGDNFTGTVFDDQAGTAISSGTPPFTGSFRPQVLLSGLNGMPANGTWTLEIADAVSPNSGTLHSWSLSITKPPDTYQCGSCNIAAPGEATNLLFTSKSSASWSGAAGASLYYMYRGESADLPNLLNGSVDSCQRGSTTGLSLSAIGDPPAGLQWYLVRGWNTGGFGSPGNATAGARIQNSSGACP
jgi:subtilisin-like proprotein convertase family protein